MNHEEALQSGAVEKYLLNELAPPQRDAFEEHYFDCPVCALDLETAAAFLDGAKRELAQPRGGSGAAHAPRKPWWKFLWTPAFAGPAYGVLLLVIVCQSAGVLPRGSTVATRAVGPEVLAPLSLIGANSRGGGMPAVSVAATGSVALSLDIPTSDRFSTYDCVLMAPSGGAVWTLPVTAAQARDTVTIRVPAGTLTPGEYRLIVRGQGPAAPADLASYRFAVTRSSE